MKRFLSFLIFLLPAASFGQFRNLSIKASAVFPLIGDKVQQSNITAVPIATTGYSSYTLNAGNVRETFGEKTGFQLGGRIDYGLSNSFFLNSGITVQQLRFRRSVRVESIESSVVTRTLNPLYPAGTPYPVLTGTPYSLYRDTAPYYLVGVVPISQPSDKLGNTELFYLQMPVMAGVYLFDKKMIVRSGFSFSYLLDANVRKQEYSGLTHSFSERNTDSDGDFKTFACGAVLDVSYTVFRNLFADVSFSRNFSPIYATHQQQAGKAKLSMVTAGLGYKF